MDIIKNKTIEYSIIVDEETIKAQNTNYGSAIIELNENEILADRLQELKKQTPLFLSLLKFEDFDFGYKSQSIILIEEQLKINRVATATWINELYIRNFSDDQIIIGILRLFEYFPEEAFYPQSYTIAIGSLLHKNDEIKELGLRIFENWPSIETYNILTTIETNVKWLDNYKNKIILDLKKELCLS